MNNQIELHYKLIGEGQPVVVLHGLFGMLDNLQLFGKGLSEKGYMVYLVDQRDHGKSPFTREFSYPILANDLFHFMEDQWLHRSVLIGHSMGGKTALKFVIDHPGIITKLIVIDIGIKEYARNHEAIFDALLSIPLDRVTNREEVHQMLLKKIQDEGTVLFLMKNLKRNKVTQVFEWKMNLSLLRANYDHILAGIKVEGENDTEVLFVRGQHSNYIEDNDINGILQYFPRARFATIPEAGHWVHADNLSGLLQEIISFLET